MYSLKKMKNRVIHTSIFDDLSSSPKEDKSSNVLVCYCFHLLHLKKTNHVIVFPVFHLIGEYIFLDLSILSISPAVVRSFLKAHAI